MPDEPPAPQPQMATPQIINFGLNLPLPPPLQLKRNTSVNWKRFQQAWNNYEITSRLKTQDKELRTATLMTFIGQDALEIYDGLAFDNDDQRKDTDLVLQKLGEFCVNTTNEIYERYAFNKWDQGVSKSIDAYAASLHSLVKTCSYGALTDNLNRDHMVVGILDKGIRKKLLQESKLTLQSCIDICRPNECMKQQLQTMDQPEEVHVVDKKKPKVDQRNSKGDMPSDKPHKQINC